MNIPTSALAPFVYTGVPPIEWMRSHDDKIRDIVKYARAMYSGIPSPIVTADIEMMKTLLWKLGAQEVHLTWEKEECERGYHHLSFQIKGEPGIISARLYPLWK